MTRCARLIRIAREMIPGLEIWTRSLIRASLGLVLIGLSNVNGLQWGAVAGPVLITLAAIGLAGHAELVFATHAAAKLRGVVNYLKALALIPVAIIGALVLACKMSDDDVDGRPN